MRVSSSTPSEKDNLNRIQQNQEVEEEREVLDVVEVILQLLY
jgi:hypothetical protein